MRNFKLALTLLAIISCSMASAQSARTDRADASTAMSNGWKMFYLQYSPTVEYANYTYTDVTVNSKLSLSGVTMGYAHAYPVTKSLPLFVEVGGELKYSFRNQSDRKENFISIKAPVNLTYDFSVTDQIDILPFVGLYGRYNISGTNKEKVVNGEVTQWIKTDLFHNYTQETSNGITYLTAENSFARVQLGAQIGSQIVYDHKYIAGISYSHDLTKLMETTERSVSSYAFNISLGFIF